MALFKSLILSEARGSLNGLTFSRNGNAAYIKGKSIPVNPRSDAQTANRALLNSIATSWRQLTEPQRESWKALAQTVPYQNKVGDTVYYSGFQIFMKLILARFLYNSAVLVSAPASQPTFPTINFTGFVGEQDGADFEEFSLIYDTAVFGDATGFIIQLEATDAMSAGKSFIPESAFRRLLYTTGTPVSTQVNITGVWELVYGTPTQSLVGSAINIRTRMIDPLTGFTSPWVYQKAVIAEA